MIANLIVTDLRFLLLFNYIFLRFTTFHFILSFIFFHGNIILNIIFIIIIIIGELMVIRISSLLLFKLRCMINIIMILRILELFSLQIHFWKLWIILLLSIIINIIFRLRIMWRRCFVFILIFNKVIGSMCRCWTLVTFCLCYFSSSHFIV